jgi:hypothetical protein
MIAVNCPKCKKAYNLGDDKAGRTFRCQQCQAPVKVPAAARDDDPFASDWEEEIPEAKPAARSRSSSRPKAKSSSGGGSGILIGIGAGVLLFAIAAAVIFVIMDRRNRHADDNNVADNAGGGGSNEESNDDSLIVPVDVPDESRFAAVSYLPPHPPLAIAIKGQDVWRHRIFQHMFGSDHGDNTFAAMMLDVFGFHPDEFLRIAVTIEAESEIDLANTPWIAAVDLRDAIDWGARTHPQFNSRAIGEETVYDLAGKLGRDFAAWQPLPKVLVYGDRTLVEQAIARGPSDQPHVLLDKITNVSQFGIAGDLVSCEWLHALVQSWSSEPIDTTVFRFVAMNHSFGNNPGTGAYEWQCDVDLYGSRAITEQEVQPFINGAFSALNLAGGTATFAPLPQSARVSITYPGFPVFVLAFVSEQLEAMKLGAYQVAGRAPPSPVTAIVVNVPITTTTTERAPAVGSNPPSRNDGETGIGTPPVFDDAVRPPVLALDFERLRTAADSADLATFVETFYPAGSRQSPRSVNENKAIALMWALMHATPTFSADGREATFRVAPDFEPGDTPSVPEATGYGSDLEVALQSAIDSLEAGAIPEFVGNMFPLTELNRLRDNADAQVHLDTRLQVFPAMAEAMKAELQECLDAGISQGEAIAEVILVKGRRTPRVVRFQLVGGNWRFYDPGVLLGDSSADAEFETVTLVHDGTFWRLKEIPEYLE